MAEAKMIEAKIKELVKKRGTIKAKVTQFIAYFNLIKNCTQLSEVQITELSFRLNKIDGLYADYDAFQTELETLADDPNELYTERQQFETQYYSVIASAQLLTEKRQGSSARRQLETEASSIDALTVVTHKQNCIKLPKIDVPHFNGNYHNWLEFRDTFTSLIHSNKDIDDITKFHYLLSALQGSAVSVIKNLDFTGNNYITAWDLLHDRYNNKRLLVNNHVQALFQTRSIQKESSKDLRYLIDSIHKNLRALHTLDQHTEHWDILIIYIMSSKLDSVTNREWEECRSGLTDSPTLKDFTTFLSNRADLLETLEESKINKYKSDHTDTYKKSHTHNNNKSQTFITTSTRNNYKPNISLSCPLCKDQHYLFNCRSFRDLPVDSRKQKADELQVCLNCLRSGHTHKKCNLGHCKYCTMKHNTLLHINSDYTNDNVMAFPTHNSTNSNKAQHLLLSTAMVKVFDINGKPHTARVLLDNGSTANFITRDLCGKLKVHTSAVQSKVTGINNQESCSTQSCSLQLQSLQGTYKMQIDCFVLPHVTTSLPLTYIDVRNLCIPTDVSLADPTFNIPSSIDILVGADVFWRVIGSRRIELGKNKLTLFETRLGWLISGTYCENTSKVHNKKVSSLCMFGVGSQPDLSRFWELDTISTKHNHTKEEHLCKQSFIQNTKRNNCNRFTVTIPLKESPDALSDSYSMAKRRFLSLERRFIRDPSFKQRYIDFMQDYINSNHMTENTACSPCNAVSYFLPHHGVIKEASTTTKLRVVFDASAKTTTGKSFNDIQLIGPTVQDDLLSILLRFRQHRYVVTADIEKMYRQIEVEESQRSLQQILWRFDSSQPLKSYTLNTLTYGTASAPFLATRCIAQLASEARRYEVKEAIHHDFYVDDFLSGSNSIENTTKLCKGVTKILSSAQFNLRKWHSNNAKILQSIQNIDSEDFVNLSENKMSKTLGLNWKCFSDTFYFHINIHRNNLITKRVILSTISQIFDPLGLVTPFIIEK